MATIEVEGMNKKDSFFGVFFSLAFFGLLMLWLTFITISQINEEPLEDIIEIEKTPDQITMHEFETSEKQGGGSGTPTDAPYQKEYTPQAEQTIRDPNSTSTNTAIQGQSNHTNTNKSTDNQASTNNPDTDLKFNSGGTGGGNNGGKGKGFGNDEGNGSGPGKGEGKAPRIRLNDPNNANISSNISCKVSLKLTVNAEGDVIRAENIVAKTTTTNQSVISQLIANVKDQVKYNKVSGSSTEVVYLTVSISAK
ncbi:MAG: hypothetical protein ACK5B9_01080 [Flavobacteriia bacterium]|jgi:hypothetical protein